MELIQRTHIVVLTAMLFFELILYLLSIWLPFSCESTKIINLQAIQNITTPSSNLPTNGFCLFLFLLLRSRKWADAYACLDLGEIVLRV